MGELMTEVIAIVVTYNRLSLLKECISRLLSLECDVLIIDNASTDGTKEYVSGLTGNGSIVYYNTGKNLGGAGGFNIGLRKGVELGYKYLWIMDDDTYVQDDTLKALLSSAQETKDDFGWLSSVALWKDQSICNMNLQRRGINAKVDISEKHLTSAIMATFVSLFIKAETVRQYGLPIKEFFIWSDDLEYTRRISKQEKCYVVTDSRVIHWMNSNNKVGIENDSDDRMERYKYLYRNEVYVFKREGIRGLAYIIVRNLLHTIRIMVSDKPQKVDKIRIIWKSFLNGLGFNPIVEYIADK